MLSRDFGIFSNETQEHFLAGSEKKTCDVKEWNGDVLQVGDIRATIQINKKINIEQLL